MLQTAGKNACISSSFLLLLSLSLVCDLRSFRKKGHPPRGIWENMRLSGSHKEINGDGMPIVTIRWTIFRNHILMVYYCRNTGVLLVPRCNSARRWEWQQTLYWRISSTRKTRHSTRVDTVVPVPRNTPLRDQPSDPWYLTHLRPFPTQLLFHNNPESGTLPVVYILRLDWVASRWVLLSTSGCLLNDTPTGYGLCSPSLSRSALEIPITVVVCRVLFFSRLQLPPHWS